jgi:hypothetical protein
MVFPSLDFNLNVSVHQKRSHVLALELCHHVRRVSRPCHHHRLNITLLLRPFKDSFFNRVLGDESVPAGEWRRRLRD